MSDVNANIRVNIDTQAATSQLQALQQQITLMQKSMVANAKNNMSLSIDGDKATQQIMQVRDAAGQLDKALASSSRGFGASFKTMTNAFKKQGAEMELIKRRAAAISAEYKKVGDAGRGMASVIKTAGSAENLASAETAMRLQMMTRSMEQMGNAAINWGKNMQWAGRQMMVGFTVPLTIGAALAVKAFQDVEREIINLQRVYGDFDTSAAETDRVTESIKELSIEMAKLGFTARETIGLAADAAAIGFQGQDLIDVTTQATNMASLGMISQEQALDTMVSMTNAFGVQADELKGVVDYLNAVENQTVLSLDDMSQSIPLVAPVIKGLGGDIKDLSVVMTAMREGGIGANEAANALKTGLARLVTPTKQALETTSKMGMNLKNIVAENEGDFLGMINAFSDGLKNLSDLQQQQVLSDVFGKRQFARFGAMFNSLSEGGSQAAKAMELMVAPAEDLARLSEKELGAIEESSTMKMTAAIEELKMAIAPLGEMVMKFIAPLIELGTKVANIFTGMPDGVQKFIATLVAGIGIIVPAALMLVGLLANMSGNLIKAAKAGLELLFGFKGAAQGASELTLEELEQASAAQQLATAQMSVTTSLERQTVAVNSLIAAYNRLNATSGAGGRPIPAMKFATGGRVPGSGNTDKIPALLTPGEYVINKKQSQKHSGFLSALNNGSVRGFSTGFTEGPDQISGAITKSGIKVGAETEGEFRRMLDRLISSGFKASDMFDYLEDKITTAALQGESLSRVIQDVKMELPGLASYGGATEKSHVVNPIARQSEAVKAIEERGVQKANTGVLELLQALEKMGTEALDSALDVEVLGNAVSDLPKGINQATKADGVTDAAYIKTQFTDSQRKNPSELFDRMQGQLMSLGMNVEEANMAADQMGTEFLQMVDALPDDAIVVESEQLAQEMREAREAAGQTGPEIVSINKMMEEASQKVSVSVTGFGENWKILKEQSGAFRIKWKTISEKLIKDLEAQGVYLTQSGKRDGSTYTVATDTTIAKGIAPKSVKSHDTLNFSGGTGTAYTSNNSDGQKAAIAKIKAERERKAGQEAQEAYNDGKDSVEPNDSFPASQDEAARNSPHPQATTDGTDDGNAYIKAKNAAIQSGGQDTPLPAAENVQADAIEQELIQAERELEEARKKAGMAAQALSSEEIENAAAKNQSAMNTQEQTTEELENAAAKDKNAAATERNTTSEKKEEGSQKMGFMRGKAGMAGMIGGQIMSMAGMAALQAEGDKFLGVSKEMSAGFLTAAGQVNSFAGMLGPKGQIIALAATALVGAISWGVVKWREGVDEMSREAANAGMALSGVAAAAKKAADIFGKATLAEKRRMAEISDEEKLKYEEYGALLGSGGGATLIEDLKGLMPNQREDYAVDVIKEAIINGMIEANDAQTFARAIGEQMGEPKMGEDIAKNLNDYNEEFTTNTAKAMNETSTALDKFAKSTEYANLQYAKQQDLQVHYADASFVIGAATQNMTDFRNAVLAAEDDWINGRTNFEDYMAALDASREAQNIYTDALKYAKNNVSDSGGFEQAKLAIYKAQTGKTDEDVNTQNEAVAAMTGFETQYVNAVGSWFESTFMKGLDSRRDDGAGMAYTDQGVTDMYREKMKAEGLEGQELIDAMEMFTSSTNSNAFAEFSREMNEELNNVEERARQFEMDGMDFNEAAKWATQLSRPWEKASELFVEATDELAMSVTEAAEYVASEVAKQNDPNHWKWKEDEAGRTDVSNLEKEIAIDMRNIAGLQDFTNSMTDLDDVEKVFKLFNESAVPDPSSNRKNYNTEKNIQLASALGNFSDLGIDPKDLAGLSDEIAATIEAGYETGGYEGAERLSELVDGESLFSFFERASYDDGIIKPEEIDEYITKITKLKQIAPDNLQLFNIDTNSVTQIDELTEPMIDELVQLDNIFMDSTFMREGAKDLFGGFAKEMIMAGESAATVGDMIEDNLLKPMKKMEEVTGTKKEKHNKKMNMAFDIISKTYLNGREISDKDRNIVEQNLESIYGENWRDNLSQMDPIEFLMNLQGAMVWNGMDATELQNYANEVRQAARLTTDEKLQQELLDKAAEYDDVAAKLQSMGGASSGTNDAGNTPTEKSGGGGGDKDEEFDEGYKKFDPKKRWDKYREREESRHVGIIGYTEAIRRSTNLTDEQIEELKENEKAYENWKKAYKKFVKTGDDEELENWEKKYMKGGKDSGVKAGKDIATQNAANTRKIKTNKKKEYEQKNKVEGDKFLNYFDKQQLYNDPELMAQYMSSNKKLSKEAANEAKDRAMAETTVLDIYERELEVQRQILDYQQQQMDVAIMQAEYAAEKGFFEGEGKGTITIGDGVEVEVDRASLDQRQAEIAAEIKVKTAEHIDPIEDKIEAQRHVIKGLERETIANEDLVKTYEKQVDSHQRKVEGMQRALELRQREGEMLDHDLTLMGYMEEKITEAYDKRIEALDKVLEINQQIAQAQQDQLGLADALSQGDIGAAAKAAQQMQQNQMQFASDQYRSGLETAQESQINSLTGAESGMTREQIEERQRQLAEDEYQTNLKIRDIEDQIYDLNMKIRAENDIIQITKDRIEEANRKIRDLEWDKYQAEQNYLKGLLDEQVENEKLLGEADLKVVKAGALEKVERTRFERTRTLLEAEQQLQLEGLKILNEQGKLHKYNLKMIKAEAHEARKLWDILTSGETSLGNFELPPLPNVKKFINDYEAKLATIEKPKFADILLDGTTTKSPSFNVPTAAVSARAANGIMGNITNNTMNNNVNVNAQGASANEVANIVIRHFKTMESQKIGEM